jgi:SnoaL-like domain
MALSAIRSGNHLTQVGLLDHFHISASKSNLIEYFGCFNSPSSRFLGTDANENWSAIEFYDYAKPHFDAGAGWTYVPRTDSRKFEQICSDDGTCLFATFDELLDVKAFGAPARGTGSMIFDGSSKYWYLVSYHLSFPTPNELAHEICNKIAVFESKQKIKQSSDMADVVAAELLAEFESNVNLEKNTVPNKSNAKNKKSGKK